MPRVFNNQSPEQNLQKLQNSYEKLTKLAQEHQTLLEQAKYIEGQILYYKEWELAYKDQKELYEKTMLDLKNKLNEIKAALPQKRSKATLEKIYQEISRIEATINPENKLQKTTELDMLYGERAWLVETHNLKINLIEQLKEKHAEMDIWMKTPQAVTGDDFDESDYFTSMRWYEDRIEEARDQATKLLKSIEKLDPEIIELETVVFGKPKLSQTNLYNSTLPE